MLSFGVGALSHYQPVSVFQAQLTQKDWQSPRPLQTWESKHDDSHLQKEEERFSPHLISGPASLVFNFCPTFQIVLGLLRVAASAYFRRKLISAQKDVVSP